MNRHFLPIYLLLPLLAASYYLGYTPLIISCIFVIASLLSYFIYAMDKSAAKNGGWRISENTLHISALVFGWPGAIIAQQRLRHKTKKTSFRTVFWLTFTINVGAFAWVHTDEGSRMLHASTYNLEYFVVKKVGSNHAVSLFLYLTKFRKV